VSDDPPSDPFATAGPDEPDGPLDPFDGLTLDDAWIADARMVEPPARRREAEARWAQEEAEREEQAALRWRARRRRRRRRGALVLLALLLFGAAIAVADRHGPAASTWQAAPGEAPTLTLGPGTPTARPAASTERLADPVDPDAAGGTFAFFETQQGGRPVTYDPCRPIEVVVNDDEAPPGTQGIVERAVARAAEVSGLAIEITGPTNELPSDERAMYQPRRYGDRWAPVLVAWTDPGEVPGLGGDVAGLGGSVSVATQGGGRSYVSGIVVIDGPDAARMVAAGEDGTQTVEDVVLHELGHLLGLAHVDSKDELMYPEGQRDVHGYQQGDRAGLAELGRGRCVPLL
jgi:hypothetical protein